MQTQGPYEEGTCLKFRKALEIVVFREGKTEVHTIDPGIECTISDLSPFPSVSIESDALEAVLVVRLPENIEWANFFNIVKYRHLVVIK